jgi:hypothetical protein
MALALSLTSCAALQPPDATGPRSSAQPYPIIITAEESRREEAAIAWRRLSQQYGVAESVALDLQPGTSTLKSLPPGMETNVVLPKVGDAASPTEEDLRDSLRRFISQWQQLIGADPAQLSLVERVDEPSGVKLARYEQKPFRYPLRGGFGSLVIRFRSDRQVLGISSNCLPNTDRLQPAITALSPTIAAEEVASILRNGPITVTDAAGRSQTITIAANQSVEVQQLVIYAIASPGAGIELHLAWEVDLTNAPVKTVYLDAISGKSLAAS